jgi:ribonuclease T1
MKKKILSLLLSLLLLLSLCAGCTEQELAQGAVQVADAVLNELLSEEQPAPEDLPAESAAAQVQSSAHPSSDSAGQELPAPEITQQPEASRQQALAEDGSYTSAEDVCLYLQLYGRLPDNYITKNEAKDLGWQSSEGNLWQIAPGKSIGGDRFGNYEGLLPEADGRKWFECDINYQGGYRGAERILYSNDGLIYYTDDHYESFTQLYGGES